MAYLGYPFSQGAHSDAIHAIVPGLYGGLSAIQVYSRPAAPVAQALWRTACDMARGPLWRLVLPRHDHTVAGGRSAVGLVLLPTVFR